MTSNMFHLKHGVIIALDVDTMDQARMLIEAGEGIDGVVGYKTGGCAEITMAKGLPWLASELLKITNKPLIHDQQKLIPDYPLGDPTVEMLIEHACWYAQTIKESNVKGAIIYPTLTFTDPKPQTAYTKALLDSEVNPFILGRTTYDNPLKSEGGYLPDETPNLIYQRAAEEDVEYFIMPGNRPQETTLFIEIVMKSMPKSKTPKICLPGFGNQKGHIRDAFKVSASLPTYAILGPIDCINVSNIETIRESLKPYCEEALSFI